MQKSIPPMQILWRITLGCLFFAAISGWLMPDQLLAQDDYTGKKVLFVDAYHASYPWSDGIEAGIQSPFEGMGIELQTVHVDTKNHTDEAFREAVALDVLAMIEETEPDVIIATEDNAQKYLVVPYLVDTEYPIIFAGVNWDASVYGYPAANVTGMVEVELVEQLIDNLRQYAEGDRIGYLAVASNTESKAINIYQERFFDGALEVYTVTTFEEYKEAFLAMQDEVDIVFLGNNAGIDRWDETEAAQFFAGKHACANRIGAGVDRALCPNDIGEDSGRAGRMGGPGHTSDFGWNRCCRHSYR